MFWWRSWWKTRPVRLRKREREGRRASGKTTHILRPHISQGLEESGHVFPKVIVEETNTKRGSKMFIDQECETGWWDRESLEETIARMSRNVLSEGQTFEQRPEWHKRADREEIWSKASASRRVNRADMREAGLGCVLINRNEEMVNWNSDLGPESTSRVHVTTFKCHPLSGPPALQDLGVFSLSWPSKHVGIGHVCSLTSVHSLSGHWLVLMRYWVKMCCVKRSLRKSGHMSSVGILRLGKKTLSMLKTN